MRRLLRWISIIVALAPVILFILGLNDFLLKWSYFPLCISVLLWLMDLIDKGEATTSTVVMFSISTLVLLAGWMLRLPVIPVFTMTWILAMVGYWLRAKSREAADVG